MTPPVCKSFKTFEQQAELLLSRGLIGEPQEIVARLKEVNYYRLAGYLYLFRETIKDNVGSPFKAEHYRGGTTLEIVWNYYLFDRRLRLLLLDAVERVEISLRTRIAYYWAKDTQCSNPQKSDINYKSTFRKSLKKKKLIELFQKTFDRSIDDCVWHHKKTLGFTRVEDIPIWVFTELATFGELNKLFGALRECLKKEIALEFGFSEVSFFSSILMLMNQARNACAHHARIWNHQWLQKDANQLASFCPIVKNNRLSTDWNSVWTAEGWVLSDQQKPNLVLSFPPKSTAFLLTACHYLLKSSASTSSWKQRFLSLLEEEKTPRNMLKEMGFPPHWEQHPLWR